MNNKENIMEFESQSTGKKHKRIRMMPMKIIKKFKQLTKTRLQNQSLNWNRRRQFNKQTKEMKKQKQMKKTNYK